MYRHIARIAFVLVIATACGMAMVNMRDEPYGESLDFVVPYTLFWSIVPVLAAANSLIRRNYPNINDWILALVYLYFYTFYAFNGSTRGKMGAEHLHIILVPLYIPVFLLLLFLTARFLSAAAAAVVDAFRSVVKPKADN